MAAGAALTSPLPFSLESVLYRAPVEVVPVGLLEEGKPVTCEGVASSGSVGISSSRISPGRTIGGTHDPGHCPVRVPGESAERVRPRAYLVPFGNPMR